MVLLVKKNWFIWVLWEWLGRLCTRERRGRGHDDDEDAHRSVTFRSSRSAQRSFGRHPSSS